MRILPSSKQVEFINSKIRVYRGSLLLIYTPTRRVILNLHKKVIASMSLPQIRPMGKICARNRRLRDYKRHVGEPQCPSLITVSVDRYNFFFSMVTVVS